MSVSQLLLALALLLLLPLLTAARPLIGFQFSSENFFALCGCVERKVEIRFQVAQRFYCLLFPLVRSFVRSYVCVRFVRLLAHCWFQLWEKRQQSSSSSIVPKKKLQAPLFGSIRQQSRFNKTRQQQILNECNISIWYLNKRKYKIESEIL